MGIWAGVGSLSEHRPHPLAAPPSLCSCLLLPLLLLLLLFIPYPYHRFYQHLPQGCEWGFGLVWGHSVSTDLIHWQHLPHAVIPTAGTLDADGCFSGCATVDTDGTPIILYTGVRLRTNVDAQPLPPPECDLHLPFIEAQLYAVPRDPGEATPHHVFVYGLPFWRC